MRIPCILTIHAMIHGGSSVLSLEEPNQNKKSSIRSVRKRINQFGEITDDTQNDIKTGRKYLESLWDSVEKNHERKLAQGRMPYLESMMSMLPMSMSLPTKAPSQSPPTTPYKPTEVHSPTVPPVRGPTLPTREPIPTKAPIPAPSTREPIQVPTPVPFQGTLPPVRFCVEANKENVLFETLSEITERSKLQDMDTPQGKAYAFLLREKPSFVCTPTLLQRYGLTTFYFAMGGASWTNSGGWLGDKQECNWYGVDCDSNGFSTSLNLAVNNLRGKIPDEISALTTLLDIDLFFNSITGSLPDGISGLQSLGTLDLQQNLLTGLAFPGSITALTQLESYRISNNGLSGEMPTNIGYLRNLKELWAGHNAIVGTIPSDIGELRNLKTIHLNNNELTGKIPTELGLIPMESLVMNDNNFLGEIPMQLFNIASLNTIRLDSNYLFGNLPDAIGQLTDLENLRLENNNLSGQIPRSIGSMTSLVNLRLNKNQWTGTLPDVFENYEKLEFFDISDSELKGSIPTTIFSIPTLRLAYMSNCRLTGTIPPQYADPPDLRDLYLNGNKITGTIPPIASGQLKKLSEFLLQDNLISGTMPDSICALRSNFILDDLWTDCSGSLPEIECEFPKCCNRCFEAETSSTGRKKKR